MNLETEFRICLHLMRLACLPSQSFLCDRPLQTGSPWETIWQSEADWDIELEPDGETEWTDASLWENPARSPLPAWIYPDPVVIPPYAPTITLPPSSWVQLVQPSPLFGGGEAMLLCQISPCQWLAWMPEYGELILGREEFYLDSDQS